MLMMGTQQFRDMFASISCEYQPAFVCNSRLFATRRSDYLGKSIDTPKNGNVTKAFNEVYFYNKDGKAVEMHQLRAKVKETRN
jgi:hypothetical protein